MTEQLKTSTVLERTNQDTYRPVVVTNPFADTVPVEAALIHETPTGETVTVVDPLDEKIVHEAPPGKPLTHAAPLDPNGGLLATLLNREESEHFRTRWNEIQGEFVDEPRLAVQQADALVSEVIGQITEMFANEHSSLEGQWKQGKDVSTEDLRQALQRYRSFFNRLVV